MYKKCPAVYNVLTFFYKFHSLTADSDAQVGLGIPLSFTKPSLSGHFLYTGRCRQFLMDKFFILILFGLLSCASNKRVFETDYSSTDNLKLKDAVSYEKRIGSVDKTPNHLIILDTGIYPNKSNYEMATPKTFLRAEDYFEVEVEYYYSTPDSSVRVILYEWNKKDLKTFETKKELETKFNKFKNQWNSISKELNERLGSPTFKQIESDRYGNKIIEDNQSIEDTMSSIGEGTEESTTWRDDIKWDTKDRHAYLFMFGDNKTGYRQIRLVIYGE